MAGWLSGCCLDLDVPSDRPHWARGKSTHHHHLLHSTKTLMGQLSSAACPLQHRLELSSAASPLQHRLELSSADCYLSSLTQMIVAKFPGFSEIFKNCVMSSTIWVYVLSCTNEVHPWRAPGLHPRSLSFSLYINNLSSMWKGVDTCMYADDTVLHTCGNLGNPRTKTMRNCGSCVKSVFPKLSPGDTKKRTFSHYPCTIELIQIIWTWWWGGCLNPLCVVPGEKTKCAHRGDQGGLGLGAGCN